MMRRNYLNKFLACTLSFAMATSVVPLGLLNGGSGSIGVSVSASEYADMTVTSDTTLTSDRIVGNLRVNSGTLNLNGYTLTVKGDTYLGLNTSNAYININKGKLFAEGDFRIERTGNTNNYGRLTMQNVEDYVCVYGDFFTNAYYQSTMTNGILEVKGNFTQKYTSGDTNNFAPSGNHMVRLSGTSLQMVSFDRIESRFNILDIRNFSNEGVAFATPVNSVTLNINGCNVTFSGGERAGWRLTEDETFNGTLNLGSGTLDLNGHKLTVKGGLLQSGGVVNINGGELEIEGDYRIQRLNNGNYVASAGTLNMTKPADLVKVNGSFITQSSASHSNLLAAGTLEIGGDLTQVSGGSVYNFYTSGTHTVVLNGNQKQSVSIANNSQSYSRINNLKITNTSDEGVDFARYVYIVGNLHNTDSVVTTGTNIYAATSMVFADNAWNHDIRIVENRTLTEDLSISGNLILDGGTFNLNGKTLTVDGYINLGSTTLNINGGNLYVGENFNFGTANSFSGGRLTMTNVNDYVLVNGNYNNYSYNSSSGYLTAGTLEVKGNFTQRQYSTSYPLGFYATGSHKVVLSGESLQNVSFENIESRFNILDVQNETDEGVALLTPVTIVTLIDNGNKISFSGSERAGWKLTEDEIITGDLTLGMGVLDFNGHKLTITGNLIQSGGVVLVNGGELEIQGDYRIQTFRNNAYSNSAGTLNMTNTTDLVKVNGNFVM
ncbi:MAG: hypothetical protein FWG90_00945 [Oscillospiraceae bacterium]|nr:hypothetical protein [Oscillospiraceae bacterium]